MESSKYWPYSEAGQVVLVSQLESVFPNPMLAVRMRGGCWGGVRLK